MSDPREELLELIGIVRTHVAYRRALGVQAIPYAPDREAPAPEGAPKAAPASAAAAKRAPAGPPPVREPFRKAPAPTTRVAPVPSGPAPATLEEVRQALGDCTRCKLHKGRNTIVFGEGDPKAELVFVGEGPGFEEDQQGRPFVGAAGQLLTDIIVKGMRLRREDVYICNIVKCRPPENRNPEPDEVAACIGFVKQQIAVIRPKVIITLGNVPTQNLLGTKAGITKMRGTWQEYAGIPVMPTFHPSYLLRSPGEKKWVWADIRLVMTKLGIPVPEKK